MRTVRSIKAIELFKAGYNCSQSVFAAYCDVYGIDMELGLRISASFGGGLGRMREVCGCFSAISLIAGLESGSIEGPNQAQKAANYKMVQELAQEYRQASGGSIICKELLGLSKAENTYVPEARTEEYYKKRPCPALIQSACEIIEKNFPRCVSRPAD